MLEDTVTEKPLHAVRVVVRGIVQGVGFRPFVYRLARQNMLSGWVLNDEEGVKIHAQGSPQALDEFLKQLVAQAPPAARIDSLDVQPDEQENLEQFSIIESRRGINVTARISPDLCICQDCLDELRNTGDRHYLYPYINCTNCGPRFSIILGLPYDRHQTCMAQWEMCATCRREYDDPENRRFHAQPVACPQCGPTYRLAGPPGGTLGAGVGAAPAPPEPFSASAGAGPPGEPFSASVGAGPPAEPFSASVGAAPAPPSAQHAISAAADLLRQGRIVAIKGIGGYHLACDANNSAAVRLLRERKYRKDKPFAVMAANLNVARLAVHLDEELETMLTSIARPIVLAAAKIDCDEISPQNRDIGIMLPYSPLHHLLFDFGAPQLLVLTSANKSSEPIAYKDDEAFKQLSEIADAFLVGERPIARRIDDSVAGKNAFGTTIFRRARGYAPDALCTMPTEQPILALGADLKNSVTLVVNGQAFVSQHIGDLEHVANMDALSETVDDLLSMYEISPAALVVAHDAHPEYRCSQYALSLPGTKHFSIQHHQAHVASVLAERGQYNQRVLGIALDGTGFGSDGAIWGGEMFAGTICDGFNRVAHLRYAQLPGGDAAATFPPQAAAGFLFGLDTPDMTTAPFEFGARFTQAQQLIAKQIQTWKTSSTGRLFDTVAALCGFNRQISFEAQAAIWLEHLARGCDDPGEYTLFFDGKELDYRQALVEIIEDRTKDVAASVISQRFHAGLASVLVEAADRLCQEHGLDTVVFSGGVMQNMLLSNLLHQRLTPTKLTAWVNQKVPANDGGISLGQAALACFKDKQS